MLNSLLEENVWKCQLYLPIWSSEVEEENTKVGIGKEHVMKDIILKEYHQNSLVFKEIRAKPHYSNQEKGLVAERDKHQFFPTVLILFEKRFNCLICSETNVRRFLLFSSKLVHGVVLDGLLLLKGLSRARL